MDRYQAVNDFGTVINPMVIDGQVHGGIAQGLSQALREHYVVDRATGQPLSSSFMDYGLVRADELTGLRSGAARSALPDQCTRRKGRAAKPGPWARRPASLTP